MAQFKRSVQPTGFRPEEVSERNVSQLQAYSDRIIGALRDERDAVISNRNEIANAMKENAQIESQQASLNKEIQQQNTANQLKAQQDLSQRALEEYETKTKTSKEFFSTVSTLSLTASKKLREIEVKKFEEKDKAIAAEIYTMGDNHPMVKALKALKYDSQIEEVNAETQIAQAREKGVDPLTADEALKQLNELGYTSKTAILKHLAKGFGSYFRDQLIADKAYVDEATGRQFTTADAKKDQKLALILAAQEMQQYEAIHGISGQLAALKQESGYLDDMFKVTQTFGDAIGKQQHDDFILKYQEDFTFKLGTLKSAKEISDFIQNKWATLSTLLPGGRKAALDFLSEVFKKVDADGKPVFDLAGLENATIGPNGEQFGVYWKKNRVADIRVTLAQGINGVNRLKEAERQQAALDDYRAVLPGLKQQLAAAGAQDDRSIFATAEKEIFEKHGFVPKEFYDLQERNLKENQAESANKATLVLEKIRTGRATQGDVQSIADPELRSKVQEEYTKATKERKYGSNYDLTLKKIEAGAKEIMGDSLEGSGSFATFRLNLAMQRDFANEYKYALAQTNDPARALQIASNWLEKAITDGKANVVGSPYHSSSGPNNEKVFTRIKTLEAKTQAQQAESMKKLESAIRTQGVNSLNTPGLLGTDADLRALSTANANNQLLVFTPQILKAARILGITELEAANQAIGAFNKTSTNKIPVLRPDPTLQLVNNARPATRALFTDLPTRNSVLRGAAEIDRTQLLNQNTLRPSFRITTPVTGAGITVKGLNDSYGRPVVFGDQSVLEGFQLLQQLSGGRVKASDITSSQRSHAHNVKVEGSATSYHKEGSGRAMDIHGESLKWLKANPKLAAQAGWAPEPGYIGHGGHYVFGQ